MVIKSITLEQFKSIYKKTTISFPETGLWKISGDVGVGKTTLGEAILFGLYGSVKEKNIKDLISWNTKKCTASIELESRGHNIVIKRLIKKQGQGSLDIIIDGVPLEYTNKRGGQQILEEDYYDVSRTAVESLCIISFNNFKNIINQSSGSADTRKFIDDVFGFNIVNKYLDNTKIHLQEAISKYNDLASTIRTLESQKTKYEFSRDALDNEVDCTQIDALKEKIKSKRELLDNTYTTYLSQSGLWSSQKTEIWSEMCAIKERGKQLRDTVNKLKNGVCPLCGGEVSQEELDNYNKSLNECITLYKSKEIKYKEACTKKEEIEKEYSAFKNKIDKEIHSYQDEISKIQLQQKLLTNNYDKLIADLEETIKEKRAEYNESDIEKNKWQELYDKLYKESRPTLLRHYITSLNNNIAYYLRELGQSFVVKFDETFKCSISKYGVDDSVPPSSLSTGQTKVVDTAVILGLLKTLITGVNFNILFLDELFSNAHAELRNVMCNMLRSNITDRLIYIITHAEIDDAIFDGVIKTKLYHWEEDDHIIHNTEYIIK